MESELKPEEKELIRLVNYFKKRGEIMIIENRLGDEYKTMLETCDKLVESLNQHAANRAIIKKEREQLSSLVKDNAICPTCKSAANLKVIGTEQSEKGWKSNKYKCRKCNITFVWNTPNNPWDMIPYVEDFVARLVTRLAEEEMDEDSRMQTAAALQSMKANLEKLKPVVDASDKDHKELQEREAQMEDLVHKFKKHLMIEKIRLEE